MTLLNDAHQDIPQSPSDQYWTDPKTSITYFHKSCQEKCAGEYLAHIGQTDHGNFNSRMKLLNTGKMCMRLELVLRFACGSSKKVAAAILQHLLQIFRIEFSANIQEFYHEILPPNTTKHIQDFVELCLLCYYEGSLQSSANLEELFPHGQMLFFGMSPYTSSAIGQYISTHSIESIAVKAIPTLDNINNVRGVLRSAFEMIRLQLKKLPERTLRKMCEHQMMDGSETSFEKLCNAEFCKYFKDWQSSRLLSLAQMFESKVDSPICLKSFKLVGVKIGNQMEQLQDFIEQGSLSELTLLDLHNSGLSNDQVNDLLSSIRDKLPNLEWLDISRHVPVRMYNLGDKIAETRINALLVHNNGARVEDMSNFITNIPRFGSRMRVLWMAGNAIDDESGRKLGKAMPNLHRLEHFSLTVYRMKDKTHNKLIKALKHLPLLTTLNIVGSWVLDDLFLYLSKVMISFPSMNSIELASSAVINSGTYFPDPLPEWTCHRKNQTKHVKRSAAKAFTASLNSLGDLVQISLDRIPLHKEDWKALLDHCQRHGCLLR